MTHAATRIAEDDLDTLLMGLGLDSPDEIIIIPAEEILGETDLEAAVRDIGKQEALEEHYAADEAVVVVAPVVADPMVDPASLLTTPDVPTAPVAAKPTAEEKAAAKAAKLAEKAALKAAKAAEKAATPPVVKTPVARKHYASKTERVTDKLGADLGDYLVLELSDASLTGDELAAKQQETLDAMKSVGVKAQARMTFLMEFAAGKNAKLNEVALTALNVLHKDGKIVTGEKGNYHLELVKKYSKNSASAMGNNTLAALKALKMIQGEKGEYTLNPNSLYGIKVMSMIGITA